MKRHCMEAIERVAKRPLLMAPAREDQKRQRLQPCETMASSPLLSTERMEGRREGWLAGHAKGLEEGHQAAAKSFASDVVPEMERQFKASLSEMMERYDDMFLELCYEFGERDWSPRFVY